MLTGRSGCIDKKSSAELSEAVNSMFQWYKDARICYAHLADVFPGDDVQAFRRSDWFTRGWTLQELLAPDNVVFCDASWTVFGTKFDLATMISEITGIQPCYLTNRYMVPNASIATVMSWISLRRTTRKEDIAYCMFGIFDVNMPLLYGEAHKAFLRLQLEIVRRSRDQSIFVHRGGPSTHVLTDSPFHFNKCGGTTMSTDDRELTYSVTQRGLQFHVPRCSWLTHPNEGKTHTNHLVLCEFVLDCEVTVEGSQRIACLSLLKPLISIAKLDAPWIRNDIKFRHVHEITRRPDKSEEFGDAIVLVQQYIC